VITSEDIEDAPKRIDGAVYYSPCQPSIPLSEITGMEIFCKLDYLQRTGSRPRFELARKHQAVWISDEQERKERL
jgi:hypothetical protein